jgi:hypothetical protein
MIVGIGAGETFRGAVFWNQGKIFKLEDFLISHGVTGLQDWNLWFPNAISHDGRTIVGEGFNPQGVREAWIVTIPEPSSALLAIVGVIALGRTIDRRHRAKHKPTLLKSQASTKARSANSCAASVSLEGFASIW